MRALSGALSPAFPGRLGPVLHGVDRVELLGAGGLSGLCLVGGFKYDRGGGDVGAGAAGGA